jgi:exonuclease SbcC
VILNKVNLSNFISHKDTELDLGYGINVVVGPNGAGKTSILDAISFALFNDYSGRGKKENLINSRATKCRVAVEFTEGGIKYAVEWSMEKNKSAKGSLYRLEDGSRSLRVQGGGNAVVPEIESILGIDKSMFLQSIYVRQGEIEELVMAKPAERKTIISKLLGVEDLQRAWESIRSIIDEFERTSDQLKGELAQRSSIQDDRQKYVGAVKESETQMKTKKTELSELDSKIDDLRALVDKLKADKQAFDRLDKQKSVVETGIRAEEKSLSDKRGELEEAVRSEERVKSLEGEVSKLDALENFVAAISQKREQESEQQRLAERLDHRSQLEKTLKENEAGHALCLEKEKLLRGKADERKRLEGVSGVLEKTSKHMLQIQKDEQKKSAELAKELAKWSKAVEEEITPDNFESSLGRKREEFRLFAEEQGTSVNDLNGKIGGLNNKLKELDDNISKFKEAGDKTTNCPTCETELPTERVSQLLEKFIAEKSRIETQVRSINGELERVVECKREADEKFRRVDQLDAEKLKSLREELAEKSAELAQQKTEIKQLEEQAKALSVLDAELRKLESEKENAREAFQEFESSKRELSRLPSREEVEAEMAPVIKALGAASERVQEAVANLGFEPEEPEKQLASLRVKKREYDQNMVMAGRRSEFEEAVKTVGHDLQEKQRELAETNAAIEELAYDDEEYSTVQREFDVEKENKGELEKYITRLTTEKKAAESEIENCDKKLKDLKDKEKQKKAVDDFIGLLDKIRTTYGKDGVQKMIRATARPLLEKSTRDLFERFNLAYSDIKIDDDYNIAVIGSSGEQDIDQISGGERVALAIALRLAIAQVLSGRVETIIMDEPTTHLDEERRKELVNILSSFFREGGRIIPQMLIITHHPEIEDVADVIYNIKKENGYSISELGSPSKDTG